MLVSELRVKDVFDETRRLIDISATEAAIYVIVVFSVGFIFDYFGLEDGSSFISSVVNLIAGYYLTKSIIEKAILTSDYGPLGGLWLYFRLGFLSSIAIIFGYILLIIPGIYLMARWLPAYGIALVEEGGAIKALGRSWDETSEYWRPLLGALMLPLAVFAIGIAALALSGTENGSMSLFTSVVSNLTFSVGSLIFTGIGLASYSLLRDRGRELKEVFA